MQGEFKQCPNGHYYQGDSCPYCKSTAHMPTKTEIFMGSDGGTIHEEDYTEAESQKTVINDSVGHQTNIKVSHMCSHTVFGDENEADSKDSDRTIYEDGVRHGRKLAGWLVSYTLDNLGVDFKLFEGRNIIGRDPDCSITVADSHISGKHALIRVRLTPDGNKYSLTDQQSSLGTFLNGKEIDELTPCVLHDGDLIRMGNTTFKFRSSL